MVMILHEAHSSGFPKTITLQLHVDLNVNTRFVARLVFIFSFYCLGSRRMSLGKVRPLYKSDAL